MVIMYKYIQSFATHPKLPIALIESFGGLCQFQPTFFERRRRIISYAPKLPTFSLGSPLPFLGPQTGGTTLVPGRRGEERRVRYVCLRLAPSSLPSFLLLGQMPVISTQTETTAAFSEKDSRAKKGLNSFKRHRNRWIDL